MNRNTVANQLPRFVAPMLAKSGRPFDSADHLFEIKWDGTRMLAAVDRGGYRLVNATTVSGPRSTRSLSACENSLPARSWMAK
jgi:ATP-dependent DNA ligase